MRHIYRLLSLFLAVSSATALKAAVPAINSSLDSQTYWVGQDFDYTITATESPTTFFEVGLEAIGGLTLDPATGVISGAPGNSGTFELVIVAENLDGQSPVAAIDIVVVSTSITSPSTENGVVEEELSYEITTDSSESVTYNDSGALPPGLARVDNIISGTPTQAGTYPVIVSASDSNGSGAIEVTFTITDPVPFIYSSIQEEILLGDEFNYTIAATNSPTVFSQTGLDQLGPFFAALSFNSTTGVISGTPSNSGNFDISFTATNSVGSSEPVTLNLIVHPEFITSSSTVNAVVDSEFLFEISTVNNEGLSFSNNDDMPPGLTRVGNTISGTPTLAGSYDVLISAESFTNFDDQTLTITVTDPVPEINSSLADQNVLAGVPYPEYSITATYSPTAFSATGLAAVGGLTLDPATGVISGTPVNSGIFPIEISASNGAGSGDIATFNINVSPTIITSADTTSAVVGTLFTYQITTAGITPLVLSSSGDLPPGLTRVGDTISGTPTEAGTYPVTLTASSFDGSGELVVTFEVTLPPPVIDSPVSAVGILGREFNYTITASSSPTTFSVAGLDPIGGLTLDPATGVISGTPENEGVHVITVQAANSAGTSNPVEITVTIEAARTGQGIQDITIVSPTSGAAYLGSEGQVTIVAEITPASGIDIETAFIEWINPPLDPGGNPREDINVATMSLQSVVGDVHTYAGTVDLGFNPDDREVGGGQILLRVTAYQEDAIDELDYAISTISFSVAPILDFVYPTEQFPLDSISQGDIFASVRVSSGNLDTITARISGDSILDTIEGASSSLNGIYNFTAINSINFPGNYDIIITAVDDNGNTTQINKSILISDSLGQPEGAIITPTPGFVTDVFSPGIYNYFEISREIVTTLVGVIGVNVTYRLELVSSGQGYYPRNGDDITLRTSGIRRDGTDTYINVPGVDIESGRIDSLPDELTIFYNAVAGVIDESIEIGNAGTVLADDLRNPGSSGAIQISAEFVSANSTLDQFEIFVNGESILAGNLDISNGSYVIPSTRYPSVGAPLPGDYLVTAQVTDNQGETTTLTPTSFRVVTYEALDLITLSTLNSEVSQGDSVTFDVLNANPEDYADIQTMTLYYSDSEEELGTAPKVDIDGVQRFRFTQDFNSQGSFSIYAEAVAVDGRRVRSAPVAVDVEATNDLLLSLDSPLLDQSLFRGESFIFTADASSTAGVASVEWIINNESIETDTTAPYSLNYTFDTAGDYIIRAIATDNFGNTSGSVRLDSLFGTDGPGLGSGDFFLTGRATVNVTVLESDLTIALTSPTSEQTIPSGSTLDFIANARATLGVSEVRWYVNGQLVETDTATPYALNYSFPLAGSFSVYAEAEDTLGSINQTSALQINVSEANPLLRDGDFISDSFTRILGRAPTSTELTEGLAQLDGTVSSRSTYLASLISSGSLGTATITQLIYRTMTGYWLDASELLENIAVLTNNGSGVTSTDAFTMSLWPEYEARFEALDTRIGFTEQLFTNKHGVLPNAITLNRLYESVIGPSVELTDSVTVPGFSGDLTAFATQFALDNDLSNLKGPNGLPLTNLLYYAAPNSPELDAQLATLIAAMFGIEPSDEEIASFSGLSLESAVSKILKDSRYYSQFPVISTEDIFAQTMAGFGVFDINLNGPNDDADRDGLSNLDEVNDGSNPAVASNANAATTLSDAVSLGSDWYDSSWFGMFYMSSDSSNWVYSWRLGWIYVAPSSTPSAAWFYSNKLEAWLWSGSDLNGFYYHSSPSRKTWTYLLPAEADASGAWLYYFDTEDWQLVSP